MKTKPYLYQMEGSRLLAANPHFVLADDPGLGKTRQAIDAAVLCGSVHNLVVCPASVRLGWLQEIEENVGHTRGWEILSYNGAVKIHRAPTREKYDSLILDEAHFVKTSESARTQAILGADGFAHRAHNIWGLTGTPVLNRPREMYPILATLAAERITPYDSFPAFAQRFCGAYWDGRGINTRGATNLDDLAKRLQGFMLRRTKRQVLPELPEKIVTRIPIELTDADWAPVREEENKIVNREAFLSSVHEDYSQMGDNARLRRLLGIAKVRAVSAFIDDLAQTVDKVVVFFWHTDVGNALARELSIRGLGAVKYQGGMSDEDKKYIVERFQKDAGSRVFLGQMVAAGTGINGLQRVCNDVVFAEIDWTPGTMTQCVDRVDRMDKAYPGPVNAYIPNVPGSLESAMLGSNDGKTRVIDRIMKPQEVWGVSLVEKVLPDLIGYKSYQQRLIDELF